MLKVKKNSSTNWQTANPILPDEWIGIETDTNKIKFGDGATPWNSLTYIPNATNVATIVNYQNVNGTIASLATASKTVVGAINEISEATGVSADLTPNSVTVTPLTDRQAGTFRRNSVTQTSNIIDIQTEANGALANFDKTGVLTIPQFKLSALNTAPANATATGTVGDVRITATAIYVCSATNTWVRAALTTF